MAGQPKIREALPQFLEFVGDAPAVLLAHNAAFDLGFLSVALSRLFGKEAEGLSSNVVVRLKEEWTREYEQWTQRTLCDRRYVYVWADGIHVNVRLEDEETADNACWY